MVDTIRITVGLWLIVGSLMLATIQFILEPFPARHPLLPGRQRSSRQLGLK